MEISELVALMQERKQRVNALDEAMEQLKLISIKRNGSIRLLVDRNFQWLSKGGDSAIFPGICPRRLSGS